MPDHITEATAGTTIAVSAAATWLGDMQHDAVAFSALCAGLYYVTKFAPVWGDNLRRLWNWVRRR